MFYIIEPWGRDKYRQAGVLFTANTVPEAYAELDRMVARLVEQGIDLAPFEWYVVDEDWKPVRRPGAHKQQNLDDSAVEQCGMG